MVFKTNVLCFYNDRTEFFLQCAENNSGGIHGKVTETTDGYLLESNDGKYKLTVHTDSDNMHFTAESPEKINFGENITVGTGNDLKKAGEYYTILNQNSGCFDTWRADFNGDGILEFNGKPMSYELMISANDEAMGELLKAYMAEVGIELVVKAADDNTVKQTYQEGNFQLIANGHGSFGGDPKYLAVLATNTAGAAKITVQGGNRWQSEEYDSTFAASLKELDETKRGELVDKLQEIVAEDVPTLALYYKSNAAAFNNSVFDGFYYTKDGISSGIPYLYNKIILADGTWKAE